VPAPDQAAQPFTLILSYFSRFSSIGAIPAQDLTVHARSSSQFMRRPFGFYEQR
jgi:hypothetical protein